jgi:hypothetical protein
MEILEPRLRALYGERADAEKARRVLLGGGSMGVAILRAGENHE